MALSNIVKEPRREIIETAIGLAVVSGFFFADYYFAIWMQSLTADFRQGPLPLGLGMCLGAGAFAVGAFLLMACHLIGTAVCNGMRNLGCDPRPRRRW